MMDFGPEGWLSDEERNLYLNVLRIREGALAMDDTQRVRLKDTYMDPYVILTAPHEPWQQKPLPIPGAIREQVIQTLKDRIKTGLYEPASSAYSGRWFMVLKKNGKLRIVHDLQPLNTVGLKNGALPPNMEEFSEEFMGRKVYSLLDVFGGYDQWTLAEESRDFMTFQTPIGPVRLTRVPQGYTNLVGAYQRMMVALMAEEIPEFMNVFIDDGRVKGPASYYDNVTIPGNPGIRKLIWEHAVNLERILFRFEEAGLTVSGRKAAIAVPELDIVGTRVSFEGRKIDQKKVNKVKQFPTPTNTTELRGFLGLCTYVRIWIKDFAKITEPLCQLLKNGAEWDWNKKCEKVCTQLKWLVGRDILLSKLEYGPDTGKIIVALDSSATAAGAVVMQEDSEGSHKPVQYESLTFTEVESRYSQAKLELAGVVKILKKLQYLLGDSTSFWKSMQPTSSKCSPHPNSLITNDSLAAVHPAFQL